MGLSWVQILHTDGISGSIILLGPRSSPTKQWVRAIWIQVFDTDMVLLKEIEKKNTSADKSLDPD